jgi:protein-tyrosine phosphatase
LRILFVCVGNICRSPMARAIAETHHRESAASFCSAGTRAFAGDAPSTTAIAVMDELGIDIGSHRSRPLGDAIAEDPDLIYTMTAAQAEHVRTAFPLHADKVQLMDPDGADIADPYGRDITVYREARDLIAAAISRRAGDWPR